ncbi:MAG: non-hydrolyzing UDP-N-acetylglucosamine 2-epimerase [Candidatus Xenobia bacterium]
MKRILIVFGTRPEAVKMAPLVNAFKAVGEVETKVLVTAQHREMLDQVTRLFGITPDYDLNLMTPRQTLTDLTCNVLKGMRDMLERERFDYVFVHGDTTTAFATAIAAFYQKMPVAHVEAGLRTDDLYTPFPEEMNRRVVDTLCSLFFAPTPSARQNLLREGYADADIYLTGNTAIDALKQIAVQDYTFEEPLASYPFDNRRVVAVTAHRRENWGERMESICHAVNAIVEQNPQVGVVFSVHMNPQVREVVARIIRKNDRVLLVDPMDYLPWLNVMKRSSIVLTDSGGIQEEAPSLGKPVLVMRDTTERPDAVDYGTVRLIGTDFDRIVSEVNRLVREPVAYQAMAKAVNPYGDGQACRRIVHATLYRLGLRPSPPETFDPGPLPTAEQPAFTAKG